MTRRRQLQALALAAAAAVACWCCVRTREAFAQWGLFDHKLLDPLPTGKPGHSEWDAEMLPTFYPRVLNFTNTLPPDPGVRTIRSPDGGECVCPRPHPYDYHDIKRSTVCARATGQAFSSKCAANCMGFRDSELYACKPLWALFRAG